MRQGLGMRLLCNHWVAKHFLMRKFQTQIIITAKVFQFPVELLSTSNTIATCQYSQNWWGQILFALTSSSLRLVQNCLQMPVKWTLRRSINHWKHCKNITEKYEQVAQFRFSDCNIYLSVHELTAHPKLIFNISFTLSPWMFVDRCRQTQNLLKWGICEAECIAYTL